ncbi:MULTISPECIES: S9 family peptidase [unclassified Massilia]|uniref:alpha/beta hydrolase family protein n=1 Tax=unclassified Massilia TaxID=2609279 RepID=UPI001E3020E1|nr:MULTISPECIES: alpha/beta fold hydrolase [unclassified Massilia]
MKSSLLLAAMLACAGVHAANPSAQEERFEANGLALSRVTLQGGAGAPVRYFLSRPASRSPLVLFIQGSGCVPSFLMDGQERKSSIPYWATLASRGRYAVMAVDKPYQSDEPQQGPFGSAIGCAGEFNAHFSYETWLATLKDALRHALSRPEVDPRRVLLVGISEGAPMAAGLAREMPEVTDVALVGATGTTQLFDFAAGIQRSTDSDDKKIERLKELDDTFSAVAADPKSTSKFLWGHTHLRWSSFFAQSTIDHLSQSRARVYLASGMQDRAVPILSTEVLYAQLRVQGRDVSFRRVPDAGHGLVKDGLSREEAGKAGVKEYDAIMAWFERP